MLFIKCGIKESEIKVLKGVYYDVKNNEFIDWRSLLLLHAKHFQYLMLQTRVLSLKVYKLLF